MALTVFAHIATPQIRLTNDPNTVFFFLDHLHDRPPFRLEDDTTWDTNLEQGIAWGLRLLEKDKELHGASLNGKLFVMLSDGESWSGEVARAIERAVREHVPLHVIGVGTLAGGDLPETTIDGVDGAVTGNSRGSIARRCSASPPPAAASTSSSIAIRIATSPTPSSTRDDARRRRRPKKARSKSCIGGSSRRPRPGRARQRVPARPHRVVDSVLAAAATGAAIWGLSAGLACICATNPRMAKKSKKATPAKARKAVKKLRSKARAKAGRREARRNKTPRPMRCWRRSKARSRARSAASGSKWRPPERRASSG